MNDGITIVPAGAGDAGRIASIYNANPDFLRHHLGVAQVGQAFIQGEMAQMAAEGFVTALIFDGDAPVGVCDYRAGDTAYLSLIMIDGARRGQGLGAGGYAALEAILKGQGATRVRIDVVDDYPGNVVGFWTKRGFAPQGETALTWGDKTSHARVMTKIIR